jgi:large subunit ribosomal protein L6
MSRIGKKQVIIPAGVTAKVDGQSISVKGGKGELSFTAPDNVSVALAAGKIVVTPGDDSTQARAMWGTTRALVNNMVTGVANGFTRNLEINGVGYRAAVQGNALNLQLGYSHDIVFAIPEGITITVPKVTEIVVTGIDRQKVGQVAAEIRAFRPPEPYKGKGVKYAEETIRRKAGKAAGATGASGG